MTAIDVAFCFYDDPDYLRDADRDSRRLRSWHRQLWSKELPNGEDVEWLPEPGTLCLTCDTRHGPLRVSSDTIATTHSSYARFGVNRLWDDLSTFERSRYDRAFYTIGGFIVFPARSGSLNQRRGADPRIADRFDLTLECIRQHYLGEHDNPLAGVLTVDATFFTLFGEGPTGFAAYVDFFHLQDLVSDNSIRWLDDFEGEQWNFETPPLPQTTTTYGRYLDNVMAFVAARNVRIQNWCETVDAVETV